MDCIFTEFTFVSPVFYELSECNCITINMIYRKIIFITIIISRILISCNSPQARQTIHDDQDTSSLVKHSGNKEKKAILNSPLTHQMQHDLETYYREKLGGSRFNGAMLVARKGVIIFKRDQGYVELPNI